MFMGLRFTHENEHHGQERLLILKSLARDVRQSAASPGQTPVERNAGAILFGKREERRCEKTAEGHNQAL